MFGLLMLAVKKSPSQNGGKAVAWSSPEPLGKRRGMSWPRPQLRTHVRVRTGRQRCCPRFVMGSPVAQRGIDVDAFRAQLAPHHRGARNAMAPSAR